MRHTSYLFRRLTQPLAALIMLLAGCALPGGPHVTTTLPERQQIFHPLMLATKRLDFDSLDPATIQYASDYAVGQLIFPPLVTLDEHNLIQPWGAESWEVSADGLTWTFHIQPGMRWSDGTPIDASTYAFSINRSLDPCANPVTPYFLAGTGPELIKGSNDFDSQRCLTETGASTQSLIGKSILAPDPQTLQLVLSNPAGYFLSSLTYATAWAQPRQLIERYGTTWTGHLADGTGFGGNLFKVTLWDHHGHFRLTRNDAYWGVKPKLRQVDVTLFNDLNDEWDAFKTGAGDVGYPYGADISAAKAMRGYHADPRLMITFLLPGWQVPPFDDVRVRQAFSLAIDRVKLAAFDQDTAPTLPTLHIIPEGMPGYNPDLHDAAGRTGEAALHPALDQARALWLSYVRDKCGGLAGTCPPILFCAQSNGGRDYFTAIGKLDELLREWQEATPGSTIKQMDCRFLGQAHRGYSYQLTTRRWLADYPDPQDFLSLQLHTGIGYNQAGVSISAADNLLDQADAALGGERMALYQQAEQLFVSQAAWIPLAQPLHIYVVRPTVAGSYHEGGEGSAALVVWQRMFMTSN